MNIYTKKQTSFIWNEVASRVGLYYTIILYENWTNRRKNAMSVNANNHRHKRILTTIHTYIYTAYSYVPILRIAHIHIHLCAYILTYIIIIIIIIIVNCILTAYTRQAVGKAVFLHAFHLFSSNSLTHTHSHGYFLIQPLNLTSKKMQPNQPSQQN